MLDFQLIPLPRFAMACLTATLLATPLLPAQSQPAAVQQAIFDGHTGAQTSLRTMRTASDKTHVLYESDILLKSVGGRIERGSRPNSVGIFQPQYMWPKVNGVATVYYVIDSNSDSNATPKINTAIKTFNNDFPGVIQWVPWVSGDGTAYVDINLNANDLSGECEAAEGYEGIAAQPMGGSTMCAAGTILHEMGHIIGLWHEQSRSDASTYITFNYGNVIKGSISNFENISSVLGDAQNLALYDYASVMEYPSGSFTRNGGPVIETVPAGMPLSSSDGIPVPASADYSAGDKETIQRLYGAPPTSVTITSNPAGLQVIVDGNTITTPQVYSWALNSTHTVSVANGVQTLTGDIANSTTSATFYYTYGRWNDSTSQTHTITVAPGNGQTPFPINAPQVATYSANFIQLVPYAASVSPAGSGSVAISPQPQTYSGATGQFFVARQEATLTATPASGYNFYAYLNSPYYLPGGLGANPKTFYVPDTGLGINSTVEFSNTPVYTVDVSPDNSSSNLYVSVDNGFAYTPVNFSSMYDTTWTPGSTHTLSVGSPIYPYSSNSRFAFSGWSDGGAETHTTSPIPATSSSYIATMTPQYLAGTNFNYPPCGGSGTLTPGSPTGDDFYPSGQSLQYSATPGTGWTFAGWTYDITGTSNPASLVANDETLVFANFNITNTPLTVNSISPATVTAGAAAFTLTITGTGFAAGSNVSVNGTYRSVTYVNATTLQVAITAADVKSPALLQVFVENFPAGSSGCAVFEYQTLSVVAATAPTASVNPTSIAFANTKIGSTSSYIQATLTNNGSSTLTGIAFSLTGANASSFFLPSGHMLCGSTLAAGANCTFDAAFKPTASGPLTASVQIADNASGSPQTVALSGMGVGTTAPVVSLSPTSIAFASTRTGSTSSYIQVTLTNTGNATLSGITFSIAGANASSFFLPSGHMLCGSTLAAGANCTFEAAFKPTTTGPLTASVQIADNASGSPQTVALSGTGLGSGNAAVSLSPASIAFGNTRAGSTSAYVMVTLTNTGGATLSGIGFSIAGTNASSFFLPSNHMLCGATLAAGANCTFDVAFKPTTTGALTGAVKIADNATGSPQTLNLTGTGQ